MMDAHFSCPHCGAEVPFDAKVCPECGSDEHTGWSEGADYGESPSYDATTELSSLTIAGWVGKAAAVVAIVVVLGLVASSGAWGLRVVALLLVVGAGYGVWRLLEGTRYGEMGYDEESILCRKLLTKAHGDEQLVERLIAYEQERSPHLDRTQWIKHAIDRWERDLRSSRG